MILCYVEHGEYRTLIYNFSGVFYFNIISNFISVFILE